MTGFLPKMFLLAYLVSMVTLQPTATIAAHLSESCRIIEAAVRLPRDTGTYFLSGEEYIKYDDKENSEVSVGPIAELQIDDNMASPSAAFTLDDGRIVLVKGSNYTIYASTAEGILQKLAEGHTFPFPPDAAAIVGGAVYIFKGCSMWQITNTPISEDEPWTLLEVGSLPDIGLPCHLDSALEMSATETIFVKGAHFWRSNGLEVKERHHIDNFNICSWYICGEADWMEHGHSGPLHCNGDSRLCPLRLNQVTLAGLHNAGSGFDREFSLDLNPFPGLMNVLTQNGLPPVLNLDCMLRNHGRNITDQMERGIRHLDIDSSYNACGTLGTNHAAFCGGLMCPLIKQVRHFLAKHPHEVVTLNFNHDVRDPELVFPALTKQLKNQLGPMLNSDFRLSGDRREWPTLEEAVRNNTRVFVFFAPIIRSTHYTPIYQNNTWVHSEDLMRSTWMEFTVDEDCSKIVDNTLLQCSRIYNSSTYSGELVEVSIVPTWNGGSCVKDMARLCRPYLHKALLACQSYAHQNGVSPNVILVDYPEQEAQEMTSVFSTVYLQNLQNLITHRSDCQVKLDAAVHIPRTDISYFFIGSRVVTYSHRMEGQVAQRMMSDSNYDSAVLQDDGRILVTKDCRSRLLDESMSEASFGEWTNITSCYVHIDAAVVIDSQIHHFIGCNVTSSDQSQQDDVRQWGLPCDVDAALNFENDVYVFKGNNYWVRRLGETVFSLGGDFLSDWKIDAVCC